MRPDIATRLRIKFGLEVVGYPVTDETFQSIISGVIEEGFFTEQELADGLLVSKPSVNRWARGKNLPTPKLRVSVVEWLRNELDNKFPKN